MFLHAFSLGRPVVLTTDEGELGCITFKQITGQKETTGDATTEAAVAGICVSSVVVTVTVLGMNWHSKSFSSVFRQLLLSLLFP